MADRTVKVTLLADVRGFSAGMVQAEAAAKQLSTTFKGESETVGRGLTAVGIAAGVGVGAAVAKFADFDAEMSNVQASTHESASNMDLLRDAALEAGAKSVFSAQESAEAIDELAKAGISTSDVLGGALAGSMDLAAAGGLGVASAATIAATALTQFKLKGGDVPHVADLLAAGAGKAQGSVEDLGQALNQSGLVAEQTGLSIEETTGTLAAFASAGLTGSDAGTSFKTMLQALTPSSAEAKEKMDELGISAYDAQGNFIGMEKFAGVLQAGLKDLSVEQQNAALKTIFGADAVRAASVVFQNGAEGIGDWIDKVDDSGYAAETARLKLDNLKGDVEQLGGAFDTVFIKGGEAANAPLRLLVQGLTELVTAFGDAPPFVQQTGFAIVGLTAIIGLAGGALLLTVPKVVEFGAALSVLATSQIPGVAAASTAMIGATTRAGLALSATAKFLTGPWGVALAAAAAGVAVLTNVLDSVQSSSAEVANALQTASSAADVFNVAIKGKDVKFLSPGALDDLKDLPDVLQASADQSTNLFARFDSTHFAAFDALRDVGKQLSTLASSDLPSAQAAFKRMSDQNQLNEQDQWRLLNATEGYKEALIAQAGQLGINVTSSDEAANKQKLLELAMGTGTTATTEQGEALDNLATLAEDTSDKIQTLADTISNFGKAQFDLNSAQRDFEQSVDDANIKLLEQAAAFEEANGTLEGFSYSLDIGTQSGRDNQAALDAIAESANNMAAATLNQTGSVDQSSAAISRGRDALILQLAQFGITGDAAQAYADTLLATPETIRTQANLLGIEDAEAKLAYFTRNRSISVVVNADIPNGATFSDARDSAGFAYGGFTGSGGKFDYAGPVHKNEWVSTSETIAKPANRAALEFMHRGGDIGDWGGVQQQFIASAPVYMSSSTPTRAAGPNYFTGQLVTDTGYVIGVVKGELTKQERDNQMVQRQGWGS